MKKLSVVLFVLAAFAAASFAAPKEIVFMDSQSGANFQQWWQTIALPAAEDFLGVKIKYVVGSDAEIIERMKAWRPGQGDITVLFPKSLALFVKTPQVQLQTLTPDKIPNMRKIDPSLMVSTEGVPVGGKGAAYWVSTYALIYDSNYVKNPPSSWQEFYDRRAEWKGHIGFIRPDAKSSGGWRQPFAFLNAFCDFSKKFDPNYFLSDDHQVRLVSTMWQYNSTMIADKVPGIVWEQIPKVEVAKAAMIPPERVNSDAITYIKKNAVTIIPK
jgi:ABC-type uncharacterized transport system YnjBCD substrate-binding protein